MSSGQRGRYHPASETTEETPDPGQPDEDSTTHAAKVSADSEIVVSNIDEELADLAHESLVSSLFEPGEVVTDDELDKRAEIKNKEFKQKGGQ